MVEENFMQRANEVALPDLPQSAAPRRTLRITALTSMLAVAVAILALGFTAEGALHRDYFEYWAVGHQLVHRSNPYDSTAILKMLDELHAPPTNMILRNPPYALFIAVPLGFLGLASGAAVWSLALIAALILSIRMLRSIYGKGEDSLHLMGYVFAPVLACLMAGQIGLFLLLGITSFLYFQAEKPYIAGASLLLCALKPHLFVPFVLALLAWSVLQRSYKLLAGGATALGVSVVFSVALDHGIWSQYIAGERGENILNLFIPCMSVLFRILVNRKVEWLQFVPEIVGCVWALWFFARHRRDWSWTEHGIALLLVSVLVAPYAWFTDESLLLPAIFAGLYRAKALGRSLIPFAVIGTIASLEVVAHVPLTSPFYLWTVPAWGIWYLVTSKMRPTVVAGGLTSGSSVAAVEDAAAYHSSHPSFSA
jgi:hypothetical protein